MNEQQNPGQIIDQKDIYDNARYWRRSVALAL